MPTINEDPSHIIVWQKWRDPFGDDEDLSENLSDLDAAEYYADSPSDAVDEEAVEQDDLVVNRRRIRVMATPMGLIPFTEHTASGKIFNFWVGHTNFNITKSVTSIIEETKGVETLDIFTRYRFRIAIGKAFKDAEVMHTINERVYEHLS